MKDILRGPLSAAALLFLSLLVACGGGDAEQSAQESRPAQTIVVSLKDDGNKMRFEPAEILAQRGDVIEFIQDGLTLHNVQFIPENSPAGVDLGDDWNIPYLNEKGEVYRLTVDERFVDGRYEFICTPHQVMGMTGHLVVAGDALAAGAVDAGPSDEPVAFR